MAKIFKARCLSSRECPYESGTGHCTKKGNCGSKERRPRKA